MEDNMKLYSYDGPVLEFDRCISRRWQGSTYAVSEKKALSNLTYQAKRHMGRIANTRITLPGQIVVQ